MKDEKGSHPNEVSEVSEVISEVSQKATPNALPINPTPTIPNGPKVDTMKVRQQLCRGAPSCCFQCHGCHSRPVQTLPVSLNPRVPNLFLQAPSEVQAKSVGEVVLSWNTELESRTVRFARPSRLKLFGSCSSLSLASHVAFRLTPR